MELGFKIYFSDKVLYISQKELEAVSDGNAWRRSYLS